MEFKDIRSIDIEADGFDDAPELYILTVSGDIEIIRCVNIGGIHTEDIAILQKRVFCNIIREMIISQMFKSGIKYDADGAVDGAEFASQRDAINAYADSLYEFYNM